MTKESCGLLLLVFGGLAFMVYLASMLRYLFPALIYGSGSAAHSEQRQKIVDEVRASGLPLATIRCAGQVGGVYLRGPLMTVDVHPSGVIISPLSGSSAIRADQIKHTKYNQSLVWGRHLQITHTSQAISSPIVLAGIKEDSRFAHALNSIITKEQLQF